MELLLPKLGMLVWTFLIIIPFCLFLIAIIDILRNQFKRENTKLIWILVVLFIPFLGSVLYFLIGRKERFSQKNIS